MSADRVFSIERHAATGEASSASLRLYIARSTPNSMRAEHNLRVGLDMLRDRLRNIHLEVIDVFSHPKRAVVDGIIVTPTLLGVTAGCRMTLMGDLTDSVMLQRFLESLGGIVS